MAEIDIFESAIKAANTNLDNIKSTIDVVFNGTQEYSPGELKTAGINDRIRDIGILGVLEVISGLNLCSLLAYEVNIKNNIQGYTFDPNNPPATDQPQIVKNSYLLQKNAYLIQSDIDAFVKGEQSEILIKALIQEVEDLSSYLDDLFDPKSPSSISNKDLLTAFPTLLVSNLYLNQALQYFSGSVNSSTLTTGSIPTVMTYVNNVRTHCVKIQSINIYSSYGYFTNPALVASSNAVNSVLQTQLKQLNGLIGNDISKLVPTLQTVRQQAIAITQYCKMVLSTVRTAQSYVKIATTLVKVFTVISNFLKSLPIPSTFTVVGLSVRFSDALKKIDDLIDTVIRDLTSLSGLLNLLVATISDISADITTIIDDISKIIANLQSCSNAPKGLVDDLKSTLDSLQTTNDQLNNFVQNSLDKANNLNITYGAYTIQIIKEELLQSSANIPRRYGIALDSDGVEVVKTTPTFASNDNIIIEEVKLLLESKKLVQPTSSALSPSQLSTVQNALSYVEDNTINENFNTDINIGLDSPDNQDENSGLGLNAFMNKQKGGPALRSRMRNAMNAANSQLQQNLATANQG